MASTGPGFYRGTSHEQTPFFANKEAKMIDAYHWPAYFNERVDFAKISLDVMKAWISQKVTDIIGTEDDIVIGYVLQQLLHEPDKDQIADTPSDEPGASAAMAVDPRKVTVSLTGFMGENAFGFVADLWRLLLSAQKTENGVPTEFAEAQELERKINMEKADRIRQELAKLQAFKGGKSSLSHGRFQLCSQRLVTERTGRILT